MNNPITRDAVAEKLEYMRNGADYMVRHAEAAGAITCIASYALTLHHPVLNNSILTMTAYPGTD